MLVDKGHEYLEEERRPTRVAVGLLPGCVAGGRRENARQKPKIGPADQFVLFQVKYTCWESFQVHGCVFSSRTPWFWHYEAMHTHHLSPDIPRSMSHPPHHTGKGGASCSADNKHVRMKLWLQLLLVPALVLATTTGKVRNLGGIAGAGDANACVRVRVTQCVCVVACMSRASECTRSA